MQINYTADAFSSLIQLVNYIEAFNTRDAGMRRLNRYESFLQKKLLNPKQIRLCHNSTFNKLNLRCIYFNDWFIAFSVHENYILIEAILHKSRISDYNRQICLNVPVTSKCFYEVPPFAVIPCSSAIK